MSRNIKSNQSNTTENTPALRDTKSGKILFTEYREKMCALLIRDNRLIAAQALSNEVNRIGSVFIGKVKNVVKNIDACFLEIADGEICFLATKDASNAILCNRKYDGRLLEGDEILIQISKEAQKTKQTSVTADISLSNEYAAISIGSRRIGYSGKLDKARREEIGDWLKEAKISDGINFVGQNDAYSVGSNYDLSLSIGLVVRTKANDCSKDELLHHIRTLYDDFLKVIQTASYRTCFSCIRQAPEEFETVLDQLAYSYEYEEIVTDDAILYNKLNTYCSERMPDKSIRLYTDEQFTLSKLYSLEQKMDSALSTRIWLKSGGYLIIEPTEALTVIDVNSGKYEAQKASAYEIINREAAEEIALQIRLRNLSGMIVVDFINMDSKESKEALLEYLRVLVRKDKIKTNVIDMTPLGLVEITRKKRNKPLKEQF